MLEIGINELIIDCDSYKASHFLQYPVGTTSMFDYFESRGGSYSHTLFYGLQMLIKKYLTIRVTKEMVDEANAFITAHGEPFPYDGWMHIVNDLDGKLPIRIRAVPEGTLVPVSNALYTVEATDPEVYWIVSWLETMLVRLWYPCTVATRSYFIKKMIMESLMRSADNPDAEISFKLHDFGARGSTSRESAEIGGSAHLVNFMGSDTLIGIRGAYKYYNEPMAAFSIPASEHSTITSWGRENEAEAYRNMLKQFANPGALVAIVSDSYDLYNAITNIWGEELRQEVIDSGATIIIRPDSGNPPEVVLKSLQLLEEKFGSTKNRKGYRVLNNVRVIQGDGINEDSIREILNVVMDAGFSTSNVNFGMGGGLLQQLDRDTAKFAFKCSSITVNGEQREVMKDPITDSGKRSKPGRLDLITYGEERVPGDKRFATVRLVDDATAFEASAMRTVFENGELLVDDTFEAIRERASTQVLGVYTGTEADDIVAESAF